MLNKLNLFTEKLHLLPALLLAILGLGVAFGGSRYQIGTLTAMGPGFMPALLGFLLVILALGVFLSEFHKEALVTQSFSFRPMICIGSSILVWTLLVETVGFIPAGLINLLLAYTALSQSSWKKVLISSALITGLSYVLFVLLLGIPLQALAW